jgi:N-acetylglucosamine-6-sulfatase
VGELEVRTLPSRAVDLAGLGPDVPVERTDPYAAARQAENLAQVADGNDSVVFLGDSITDKFDNPMFPGNGSAVWAAKLAPMGAADFGVGGDTTNDLLWRVQNGELAGQPRVAVVEIGTNNLGLLGQSPGQTAAGIAAVVSAVRQVSPDTQVLVLGILPRGTGADDPLAVEARQVNALIAGLADGDHVHYLDVGSAVAGPDGAAAPALMPDLVHPDAAGYGRLADALVGPIQSLLSLNPPASPASPPAPLQAATVIDATSSEGLASEDGALLAPPPDLPVFPTPSDPKASHPSGWLGG